MNEVVTRRVRAGAPPEPLTEEEIRALLENWEEPPKKPASLADRVGLDLALLGCIVWFAFVVYLLWW